MNALFCPLTTVTPSAPCKPLTPNFANNVRSKIVRCHMTLHVQVR